jgi:hypothetical protein
MKVLLTGATGFVGTHLTKKLEGAGHEVLPVSRKRGAAFDWSEESLRRGVDAADAVISLAGENLFAKRWNAVQKQVLWSSRVEGTTGLARLAAQRKPRCLLSASAIGWYGPSDDRELDERSPRGNDFLAELCLDWEAATEAAVEAGVRTAVVRIGVVLGDGGGALARMLPPFRLGLGGPLGHGRQWISWVHVDDLCGLFLFLLENEHASGVYNATAPEPVTMKELSRTLAGVLHRPAFFPVPAPVLKLALGEAASILLTGQRVKPGRALEAGYRFAYPELEGALRQITGRADSGAPEVKTV